MAAVRDPDGGENMTGIIKRARAPIVVGLDGAEASLIAMRWAVQAAQLHRADVLLIFVSDQLRCAPYAGSADVSPWVTGDADGRALLACARLEAARALTPDRVSSELVAGSPAKVLIDRSAAAELLVLGTAYPVCAPANQVPPAMGSVARACLHGAACPVVIVPAHWGCVSACA
jgi:nucleotide-binding universal stress UspA family protein